MTLPLARAVAPADAAFPASYTISSEPKQLRVLVADDNRDSADSFSMLLEMSGHEVRTAYSGREALMIATEFAPHVVLLDISMPEMNGYEVARGIRAAEWGKHMVRVAVTGWGQLEDKRHARVAGFDHHLTKPLDLKLLEALFAQQAGNN